MKKWSLLIIVMVVGILGIESCKKSNSVESTPSDAVPNDIFPLTPGHKLVFSGYLTSEDTETPIPGTESVFSASWTIAGTTSLAQVLFTAATGILPSSAVLIVDTVTVTGVLPEPKATPVFVYYDASSNVYHYLTNFGYVFRSYSINDGNGHVRSDSLRFITLASPSVGTGVDFEVFHESFDSYRFGTIAVPIDVSIKGNFEKKEDLTLTVNGKDTTFTTYYLVITNTATIPNFSPVTSITAKFWLAEGIGPVQMFLAGDAEAPGSFRKLTAKNF